jgi:hypothetical protein
VDFVHAVARLEELSLVSEAQVATALGLTKEDLERALADRFDPRRLDPPEGWKLALARLLRERADQLLQFASGLEATENRRAL